MHFAVLAGEATNGMSETMKTAIGNSFDAVKTDVTDIVTIALPVGLGIMALVLAITLGVKFFKRVSKSS